MAGNAGDGLFSYVPISQASPISIELWFWQFWVKGVSQYLLAWDNAVNPSTFIWLLNTGPVQTNINASPALQSPSAPAIQTWHHVVTVFTGTAFTLWLDNVAVATTAYTSTFTINRDIGLGNLPTGANVYSGFLAEVAVYGYALIGAQIANHFNAADQRTQAPIFRGPSTFTGGGTTVTQLEKFIASTYLNSP